MYYEKRSGKAIVVVIENGKPAFKKYRNVRIDDWGRKRFMKMMKVQFPAAQHANFYDEQKRFYLQEKFSLPL